MTWPTIRKTAWPGGVVPNVTDYDAARATFSWDAARARLDGLPDGRGINIAHEAVDRHAAGSRAGKDAFLWIARDGVVTEVTYAELRTRTNRFANALRDLGVGRGERVFTLLGRVPELYVTVLGTLKNRCVLAPLFSAFGPEPIRQRLDRGDGRVLVTTPTLYRRKVAPIRDVLPALEHVLLVGEGAGGIDGTLAFDDVLAAASAEFEIPPTHPEDMALLHFTSGTTGTPKGAVHVHDAVVAHHATAATALDLHGDDVFWCTADPGWVTGTSYGIIAPLTHGLTSVVDEAEFDAERWYRILEDHRVTVWYTAPTALRLLMRAGPDLARDHDLSSLRFVASVGEPLHPEVVVWGEEALGLPVHDNWWQTETGGIMIANLAGEDIRPGSMGRPLPGVEAALLRRGPDGRAAVRDGAVEVVDEPGVDGELALRPGWPSMFRGYLHEEERYARCFADGWYLTGDVARRDADGWVWFVGRADDVIKSAGHLIGPFEVESVLMEHPAVVEAGVIGVPDPVAGEVVKAFVTLHRGHEPSDDLRLELLGLARRRLGPAVAPREIAFDPHLPKTKSGKIMRRLLRARELGLPEGDLSTLEVVP
ncbi:MAG TPA: acetate--CoA ligase [Acidimicrobiales bacterium]|nr:acetate--CoA ligase [Acidimicrobiales bacterium]